MFNKIKLSTITALIDMLFYLIYKIGALRKSTKGATMNGIKETKDALLFGVSMAMAVDQSTQDGFQWTDVLTMIPPLAKLPAAIEGIESVESEINDLDETERAELVAAIKDLDFASEPSEAIAEQSLRVGVELSKLILTIREARNANK